MSLHIRSLSHVPSWISPLLKKPAMKQSLCRLSSKQLFSFVHQDLSGEVVGNHRYFLLRSLSSIPHPPLSITPPDYFKTGPLRDLGYLGAAFAGLFLFSSCQAEESSILKEEPLIKGKDDRDVQHGFVLSSRQIQNIWHTSLKELCAAQPAVLKWLKICAFLNSDQIPLSWLKHWVKEPRNAEQILSTLAGFDLIQYSGEKNFFSISTILQEVIRDELSDAEKQQIVQEVLAFFKSHTSMNLITTKALFDNHYFIPHIDTLVSHTNKTHYPDAVEILCRSGNYSLQKDRLLEAKDRFKKALEYCQHNSQESSLELCELLRMQGKRLPSYYGKALHYMGIILFRLGQLKTAEEFFNRSIEIRTEINRRPELYEDPDPVDSIIFLRQGKGWLLLESCDPKSLREAEHLYLTLQQQYPDSINQRYCNLQLAKVYYKLAKISESDKKQLYEKAYMHLSQTLAALEEVARKEEYYLMQSRLYTDRNSPYYNLEKAEKTLTQVIQSKSSQIQQAEAYYRLAKVSFYKYQKTKKSEDLKAGMQSVETSLKLYQKEQERYEAPLPKIIQSLQRVEQLQDKIQKAQHQT